MNIMKEKQIVNLLRKTFIFYATPTLLLILSAIFVIGCFGLDGGKNTEESKPGNREDGNRLGVDLILSEDGKHLVTRYFDNNTKKFVSFDLETFTPVEMDLDYLPDRMVFGQNGLGYFLSSNYDINDGISYWVEEASLNIGIVFRKWKFSNQYSFLSMDNTNRFIALWNTPQSNSISTYPETNNIAILDTISGMVVEHSFDYRVVDIRWIKNKDEIAIVLATDQPDETEIKFYKIFENSFRSIKVPNCPSSLEVSPDGTLAMLAPTQCFIDPVSVINLEQHKFVGNLPGFGPVVFSEDGTYAVAFARQFDLLEEAGIQTETGYSLLFIDLPNLSFDVMELGDSIPIYTITPNGQIVLLYSKYGNFHNTFGDNIVIVDVNGRHLRQASGPDIWLSEFVITPDSESVYLIDEGFYKLNLLTGKMNRIEIDCQLDNYFDVNCAPEILNITPDGKTLIMGYMNEAEYTLYNTESDKVIGSFGKSSAFEFEEQGNIL